MAEFAAEPDDIQRLLRQAAEGERAAFDELFARYRTYLQRVIDLRLDKRLRRRVDTSDVIQEAQMEAVRRLGAYLANPPMGFRLWLRQIAHDRLLMVRRKHVDAARRAVNRDLPLPDQTSLHLAQTLMANNSSPSQQLARRELTDRVRESIAQLPEMDREVLLMRNFEGLSNQEVAHVLGIDPAAASKRYGRALLRLRGLLLAEGLTEG